MITTSLRTMLGHPRASSRRQVASTIETMAVTDANPESFTRMDESTAEQWAHIGERTFANQGRVADRMIMLLESLAEISDGFITDQDRRPAGPSRR